MKRKFKDSIICGLLIGVLLTISSLLFGETLTSGTKSVGFSEKGILKEEWRYDFSWYTWGWFGSSPAISDLGPEVNKKGNEPDSDLEIITGSDEHCRYYPELGKEACGIWRAFDSKGNIEWARDTRTDESRTSPVVIDLDGDGDLEIIGGTTSGYYLQVLDHLGNFLWTFPKLPEYHTAGPYVWASSPAVADFNKEVEGLEIVIGNRVDGKVYVFDGDNSDGKDEGISLEKLDWFPYELGKEGKDWDVLWVFEPPKEEIEEGLIAPLALGSIVSTPAIADVDKDGDLEVVVASTNNNLYLLNGSNGKLEYTFKTGGPIYSSPALANIDQDEYLEIIIGSTDGKIYCFQWDDKEGKTKWVFPTQGPIFSSPSIGDIDEDGQFEIVIGSNDGKVYALTASGEKKWEFLTGGPVYSSPAIANRGKDFGFGIYIGSDDGYLYLLDGKSGKMIDRFKVYSSWFGGIHTSPSVADIDGDNKLEIVFYDWGQGSVYEGHTFWVIEDTQSQVEKYSIQWGMFRGNPTRTGTVTFYPIHPVYPEKWSFAIITDLHIGRGYPDYCGKGTGFEDKGITLENVDEKCPDYYLTERLKKVVNWLIENKEEYNIHFLSILGDISNSAERGEFLKTKKILNKLNDPNQDGNFEDGMPYIVVPVIGNHDIWPYTDYEEAPSPKKGEEFFEEIFWNPEDKNFQLMEELFKGSWKRDEIHKRYKNFAFSHKGINFIGLDFVTREPTIIGKGVGPDAVLRLESKSWLEARLEEYKGKPVIIFSHHPLAEPHSRPFYPLYPLKEISVGIPRERGNFDKDEIKKLKNIIYEKTDEGKQILGTFGGHIHGFERLGKELFQEAIDIKIGMDIFMDANWEYPFIENTPAITTEALMVGSNEKDEDLKEHNKGIIRIVKILDKGEINYKTIEGKYNPETKEGKEFIALNPSLDFEYSGEGIGWVFFKAHAFTKRNHTFTWDFGDGNFGSGEWEHHWYKEAGEYNVTLIVRDNETGKEEKITRKIKIKEEAIIPWIIKIKEEMKERLELISTTLGTNLTEFGRTMRDWVLIKVKHSPSTPVGVINVHFEQATEDIDLTDMVADSDLKKRKAILYMSKWPEVIEEKKVLFIPSTGRGSVYICPEAKTLSEVNPQCRDLTTLKVGETKNGLTLTTLLYNDQEYYLVYGIKSGGGGEITPMAYKQLAINNLESIKDKVNPRLKMFISRAIKSIERSLNDKFWQDEDNLKYERRLGKRAFIQEAIAARHLERALKRKRLTEEERTIIKETLNYLILADQILTQDSLKEAKKYKGTNKKIDQYLKKAEDNLEKAKDYLEKERYQRAILKFALSWQSSQKVIKLGGK